MLTLFISLLIAVGGALGLVFLSSTLNLETYITKIFPFIPILYAIVYEAIEKKRSRKAKTVYLTEEKEGLKAGAAMIFRNLTFARIALDVGIALLVKAALEIMVTMVQLYLRQESFANLYGNFNIETVGRILRGEHPWLGYSQAIPMLMLIALATCLCTGLWIGKTTKANAILEGVIAGAIVTFITYLTNLLILYRQIENFSDQIIQKFGSVAHIGFIVVISLQVMLYGLFSGFAQRSKMKRTASKRAGRKSRR